MTREKKPVKEHWVGARFDLAGKNKIDEYCDAADISTGDLIRRAANEYMVNHPVKRARPAKRIAIKKPGGDDE